MLRYPFTRGIVSVLAAAVLVAGMALFMACTSSEEPTTPTAPSFNYPHPNGAEWVYSYQGTNKTRYVISGNFNHPVAGDTQKLFEYLWSNDAWQQVGVYYLKVTGNDVTVYLDKQNGDFFRMLKFPLGVGNQWDAGLGYTANVSVKETISVPAGSFECYKVEYKYTGLTMVTFWWPANVGGMGAKRYGFWCGSGVPISVELASYNLPS